MSKYILVILLFNMCASQDQYSGYRLISKYKLNEENKTSEESITEMEIGRTNIFTNHSMIVTTELVEIKDNKKIFNVSFDNVISTQRINEKTKPDRDLNKLEDELFTYTVDENGMLIDHSVTPNWAEQYIRGRLNKNIFYPFGSDSLRKSGDSWKVVSEEKFFNLAGFEDAEGTQITETEYKLKKVKKKKGKEIAYINVNGKTTSTGHYNVLSLSMQSKSEGSFEGKITFDISAGKIIKKRIEGNTDLKMIEMEGDREFEFFRSTSTLLKNKD